FADVPREADAWLELLPLIGDSAVGRESRIGQERRIRRLLRIDGLRHDLRVPAQAIIERQAAAGLPAILDEQCELVIVDIGSASRIARDAVGAAALQVEIQRSASRGRSCWT